MDGSPRLFCLDHVMIDVVLRVATLPVRGGDVRADDTLITTGGGFNAMSAAARHGMRVSYAGPLGRGTFSSMALGDLHREGIDTPVAPREDVDAGFCVVLVEPDAERSFVTSPGAEATLGANDLSSLEVRDGDYVLVSGYNIMDDGGSNAVLEWLDLLSSGVIVAFDPAARMTDIPLTSLEVVMRRANWIFSNASEAQALTGRRDPIESAALLRDRYRNLDVLVRNARQGCVLARQGHDVATVAGFATNVVDTNGAGDVHNGVFLSQLAQGRDPIEGARWANAAAAMAIAQLGPATCPTRDEVERWIATKSVS